MILTLLHSFVNLKLPSQNQCPMFNIEDEFVQ
ncbi:hypothetical protein Slin_0815 [Spirosoma linguale DSM 74]|uniref:Uncharacterized protein n=1 Tax=Spirosoma linguale (strain ATCC 33905 / DSM 74 / LMG 10896 / Claus 1) TaxID=504472 RepID=D2QHZ0_SPILD|nr:hypothetical protein Slin_0815 [Spirosoma linguale DSM 74]